MRKRLTDASIKDAIATAERRKQVVCLWDLEPSGFLIKVMPRSDKFPEGRVSYVIHRRAGGRKSKQVKQVFGSFPSLALEDARKQAHTLIAKVRNDIDITQHRKAFFEAKRVEFENEQTKPFEKVFEEYRKRNTTGGAYWEKQLPYFQKTYFNPQLGKKAVTSITKPDIKALLASIEKQSMQLKASMYLKPFFKGLLDQDEITVDPMASLAAIKRGEDRDRVLTKDELKAVWRATEEFKREGNSIGNCYQLLLLTGQRLEEIFHLEKAELSLGEGFYTLKASRSKNKKAHIVHLTELALKNFENIKNKSDTLVFPTNRGNKFNDFGRAKNSLDEKIAKHLGRSIENFQVRDWRRTWASICVSLGLNSEIVDRCLNHVSDGQTGVKGIYQRYEYLPERKACMEAFSKYIAEHIA